MRKVFFFHLILLGIPSRLILSFKKRGVGVVWEWFTEETKPAEREWSYFRRSLIIFYVPFREKPKPFYMVISTQWLIVVPYQNILITGSNALRITTERKYFSVFFALRGAEKVGQKKIFQNTLKVRQRWKAKQKLHEENGAQDEWEFLLVRYFLHAIFPAFKLFQKIPP